MPRPNGSKNRAPRPDKKRPRDAYTERLPVKLTPKGRAELTRQREADLGFVALGDADYVRALLSHRRRELRDGAGVVPSKGKALPEFTF